MQEQIYTRTLSFNERMLLVCDELCPPVANQLFLEGEGSFDLERWRQAVAIASKANPGSRLTLKGFLGGSRWVDSGITPHVRLVDGTKWDGTGPDGAPFLLDPLPYREGPTCEVVLIEGSPLRVVFRTHHGVMDGRGTLVWAEDIFRVLRGESVLGAVSSVNDVEMARSYQSKFREEYPVEHLAPSGRAVGNESGMIWKRLRIEGKFPRILARTILLLAHKAWRHQDGVVRFGIPVDMRAHMGGERSTANLAFCIYVEVKPTSTVEEIATDIATQTKEGREAMQTKGDDLYRYVPIRLMSYKARKMIKERHTKGLYSLSGLITNVGRIPLELFHGGGFTSTAFWGIPPTIEYYPFFLGLAGHGTSMQLIITMPKVLATDGRLDEMFDCLIQGLKKDG